ncbi:hypothetical protein BTE54_12345 [Agrobacterium sp. YIC 4121]|nr:hypothetical protein BTE54_12345 [Agrobacterium sp. YIC 4121]
MKISRTVDFLPFKPMKMPPIFVQDGQKPHSPATDHQEAAIVKSYKHGCRSGACLLREPQP